MKRVTLDRRQVGKGFAAALAMPFVARLNIGEAKAHMAKAGIAMRMDGVA